MAAFALYGSALVLLHVTLQCSAQNVKCRTTRGDFTIEMHREWAPIGYDRFMELVESNFFTDQVQL